MTPRGDESRAALHGVRVLELAHVIAGPLAGALLADLGADVIHVEDPRHGDPLRGSGPTKDGSPLWWKVAARNKRSITLDLRSEAGRGLAHRLVKWADVVITNFRVETLASWNLDWRALHEIHPSLIMLQITGFGALSSRRNDPGFGKVGEARSGAAYLTGDTDGRPMFAGFSHGDSVTGLMGAMAVAVALRRRAVDPAFDGEWIDLSLPEALFRLIEWQVIVHDQLGAVPARAGNRMEIAPAAIIDTFLTRDGHWLVVTSATVRSVQNIAQLVGEPEEGYATRDLQGENADRLHERLARWISTRSLAECQEEMEHLEVVASPIYSVADIMADPTYEEIGAIVSVDDEDLGTVRMQGVIPRLHHHSGEIWRTGPKLGSDNAYVYREVLGMSENEFQELQNEKTI
jgi:crotonobetainyl-CoA:carnitine CoA-transferase CaiB-like acyl-CoA transferase